MNTEDPSCKSSNSNDAIIINEAQLVLAEKRTSLSTLRTGIAVFALPMSVLSLLIATSKNYDVVHVLHLIIPLMLINLCLIALGAYLIIRAMMKIRRYDQLLHRLKLRHSTIAEFLE
jgi:uncharacterized membrane protein YidH (DUF202 family)